MNFPAAAHRWRLVLVLTALTAAGCGGASNPSSHSQTKASSTVAASTDQTTKHSNTAPPPAASSGAATGADWATYMPRIGTSCDFSYSISGLGSSVRTHDSFRTVSVKLAGNSGIAVATFREQDEIGGQVATSSATVRYTLSDGRLQIPASGLGLSGAGDASSAYTVTGSLPSLATFAVGSAALLHFRVSTASEGTAVLGLSYQRVPDIKLRLTPAGQMDLVGLGMTFVSFGLVGGSPSQQALYDQALKRMRGLFKSTALYLAPGYGIAYVSGGPISGGAASCSG